MPGRSDTFAEPRRGSGPDRTLSTTTAIHRCAGYGPATRSTRTRFHDSAPLSHARRRNKTAPTPQTRAQRMARRRDRATAGTGRGGQTGTGRGGQTEKEAAVGQRGAPADAVWLVRFVSNSPAQCVTGRSARIGLIELTHVSS